MFEPMTRDKMTGHCDGKGWVGGRITCRSRMHFFIYCWFLNLGIQGLASQSLGGLTVPSSINNTTGSSMLSKSNT